MSAQKEDITLHSISELGEFGLVDRLKGLCLPSLKKGVEAGIGDDAAVSKEGKYYRLFCKELYSEGVHFDLSYVPMAHLGYKCVVACLSDIIAMNGEGKEVLVGLALSNRCSIEAVDTLYEGMLRACERYGLSLVGGDTVGVSQGMVISISMMGHAKEAVYRKGAKVGDKVCVTGDIGGAYAGLQILQREKNARKGNGKKPLDLQPYAYVIGRQLKPEARSDMIAFFEKKGFIPHSMIDISDGLFSEALHLAHASDVGIRLYESRIPLSRDTQAAAAALGLDPMICAEHGGEDYELLFTVDEERLSLLQEKQDIHVIGEVTKKKEYTFVSQEGKSIPIVAQGWVHWKGSI